MFRVIEQLFILLTKDQRKRFYALQIMVILMSFTEIIAVASIIPFMALVGDMNLLQQDTYISKIYRASGLISESQFVLILGVIILIILFISTVISMFTTWRLSIFATKIGTEIADRLYSYYLNREWLFHTSGSSAQLTKKISYETTRITNGVLVPLLQMNARISLALFMSLTIFIYDPKVALVGLAIFALAYFILYKLVRSRLQINGRAISQGNEERFRLMNEGFGGIKDVLLLGKAYEFIKRFKQTGGVLAYSQGTNAALAQVPRYFMELVAFGSMITLIIYLVAVHDNNLGMILPILSVYALAGFKLLPAFQQIYASTATIKGNIAAFESIHHDLTNSSQRKPLKKRIAQEHLFPKKQISFKHINFSYPGKSELFFKKLDILIPANSIIGLVGKSGSGKSTLIDILLGLIKPQEGELKVDDIVIDDNNLRSWQNTIGFVPQSIFLSEGTIAENVAFGIPREEINIAQVKQALELAHLSELVKNLEQDIHTKVGERGVQLSGGQRQRIGIARALYHEAKVLIFDEATSSLDGITEKMIMDAIHNFKGEKTIIMIAHRLKTIQECDQILLMDKGGIIDQGTYEYLIETNEYFKKMSSHA
jgi:ABC-type multidrug transport system fused ATPase/permease subunit